MQIRHHHTQTDASIGEQFVQPVLLAGEHAAEFLSVSGNVTQAAQVRFGNEGGAQETCTRQRCQPLRISHIGLATRHRLDVTGVDHPGDNTHALQRRIRSLPINSGALHNHDIRANGACPLGQRLAISLEAAKLTPLIRDAAVRLLGDGAARDLRLVHVQPYNALVDGDNVHRYPPVDVCRLQNWRCWGAPPKLLVWAHAQQPCLTCNLISKTDGVNSGYESVKARQVSYRDASSQRIFSASTSAHPPLSFFHHPGRRPGFMKVSPEQRERITAVGEDLARAHKAPAAEFMPAGYSLPDGTEVARMGAHAIDPAAPEFNKRPFTKTFIYGFYDGQMVFLEPMVSKAFLETKPNTTDPIKLPESYSTHAYYPATYSVKYDPTQREYAISMESLISK